MNDVCGTELEVGVEPGEAELDCDRGNVENLNCTSLSAVGNVGFVEGPRSGTAAKRNIGLLLEEVARC